VLDPIQLKLSCIIIISYPAQHKHKNNVSLKFQFSVLTENQIKKTKII